MDYVKKAKGTIQHDKLIFSCRSTIDDNFTDVIWYSKNDIEKTYFQMSNTSIVRFYNKKSAYKHSYKVYYFDYLIGILELGYKGKYSKYIKFTVDNPVFYNGTLPFLLFVLSDLYLEMTNISQLDIAIDNYSQNSIKKLYSCIRNEKYQLLLNRKYVKDMDKVINEIVYWNKGSRRNPNQIKSICAKSAKGDKEFTTYDKTKEIETESDKYNILNYHRLYNPDFVNIYRDEVRLGEDILKRYEKEYGKITLEMLLDKRFLFMLFQKFEQRILAVRDSKDKPVELYPTPCFENRAEVMLQHHLPVEVPTVPPSLEIANNKSIYKKNKENTMRTTRKLSAETKRKISESLKGAKNPNFGGLSPQHRNNIRIAMLHHWETVKKEIID